MERPMVFAAIVGCACVVISYFYRWALLPIAIILIALSAYFIYIGKRISVIIGIVCAFAVVLGMFSAYKRINRIEDLYNTRLTEEFVATQNAENHGDISTVYVSCISGNVIPKGTKFIFTLYDDQSVHAGDCFKASVTLHKFSEDYLRSARFGEGIFADAELNEIFDITAYNKFYRTLQRYRDSIKSAILTNIASKEAATLIAITIGDRSFLSDTFYSNVRAAGVSHVMVVSGMHLAIIMGGIFKLADKLFYQRHLRFLLCLAAVLFISGICGFTVSIQRAGIMYILAAAAPVLMRENDSLNTLGFAVVLILIFSPFTVLNVSFQLSVLATFGIVYVAPFFCSVLQKKVNNRFVMAVLSAVVNTLSATFVTLPVCVYRFESLSLVSPITNLLISYAVTFALTLNAIGLVLNLLPVIGILSRPVFITAGIFARYINFVINSLAEIPFAAVFVPRAVCVIFCVLICILLLRIAYIVKHRDNISYSDKLNNLDF